MDNDKTLKYKVFDAPNISCSRVHLKILELLYIQKRRCNGGVSEELLIKNLDEKIDLKFHIDCLNKEGYVLIKPVYDGFVTVEKFTITAKGMKLIENSNSSI